LLLLSNQIIIASFLLPGQNKTFLSFTWFISLE
jgi:hypothetical protein